ncbi:hypothetical protein [Neomoorella thermoacetica]|uniref:hypothetical protein n=1 Tax=Neomoorella thermoacetica TaxID=1525 RepID=UPI0015A6605C|nr:hypothetical protein [Moorella thermoacetica]
MTGMTLNCPLCLLYVGLPFLPGREGLYNYYDETGKPHQTTKKCVLFVKLIDIYKMAKYNQVVNTPKG